MYTKAQISLYNKSLISLLSVVLIDMLGACIVLPIITPLVTDPKYGLLIGSNEGTRTVVLGYLIDCFFVAQFIGAPILGALADKFGRRKMLMASLLGSFTGYVLFAIAIYSKNIHLCFISRIIAGFMGGNISIAQSSVADITTEKNRSKVFGYLGICFGVGFVIGPFIGGILTDSSKSVLFTMYTPYIVTALLNFLNLINIYFFLKETLNQTKNQKKVEWNQSIKNIRKAISHPVLKLIFFVNLLFFASMSCFQNYIQLFTQTKFNYNIQQVGYMFGYIGLWIIIAQALINRKLSMIYKPIKILCVSLIGYAVVLFYFPFLKNPSILFFIFPLLAICQALTIPNITAHISINSRKDEQGSILGVNQSMTSLGILIPPILDAYLIKGFNVNMPMFLAFGFALAAWVLLLYSLYVNKKTSKS